MLISVYSNQQKFSREINGEQVRIKIIEVCTKLYKSFKGAIYTPHTTGTTLQNFFLGQTLKIKEKKTKSKNLLSPKFKGCTFASSHFLKINMT